MLQRRLSNVRKKVSKYNLLMYTVVSNLRLKRKVISKLKGLLKIVGHWILR